MIKKHSGIYTFYIGLADIATICCAWILAYIVRFYTPLFLPDPLHIPNIVDYALLYAVIIPCWLVSFKLAGAYEPMRGKSLFAETVILFKGIIVMTLLLTSLTFFYREVSYSRLTIILFFFICVFLVIGGRLVMRKYLAMKRRKGFFTKNVLIVGTGKLAKTLAEKINLHPEMGLNIKGYVTDNPQEEKREDVIGNVNEIDELIDQHNIQQLYVAVELETYHQLDELLENLHDETIDIKIVPDFMKFIRLNPGVDDLDGVPIINLLETPMVGWNLIIKRFIDIVLSIVFLFIASPVMLLVVMAIKLTSSGPIIYRQERMGLDGKTFPLYKFRTMRVDAEKETGAVWAQKGDDRRTPIGAFLRSTSLDELPQFYNILKGEMSLVGPRPERPNFVHEFKTTIPLYMLRHKMKAGLTGWAQINGFRGNTSLEKRIEHDIYYIENWSLALDLKIIFLTIFKGFVNKNAY